MSEKTSADDQTDVRPDATAVAPGEVRRQELKFQRLADDLRRGILDGTWPAHSKLPTDESLSAETGFSLTTVRRAYDELVERGLVERRQGAGTFVVEQRAVARPGLSVGVMVPDTESYYPRVLQGIENALAAAGARMSLVCSRYDAAAEDVAIDRLVSGGVDGLLLVPGLHHLADPLARIDSLNSLPVPFVLVERRLLEHSTKDSTFHVGTDHVGGAFDAVRHLAGLGHASVGLVLRGDAPTSPAVERGWREACIDLGLPELAVISHPKEGWTSSAAARAVRQIVSSTTAVLCCGDREAMLIEAAAARDGVRVPEDVALVSYDDEIADVAPVPLTAVSPPKFRLVLKRIAEKDAFPPHQILLRPRLVVRGSCGAARTPQT